MALPTHELRIWDPETKGYTVAGAAWQGADGRFSVKLNPGVVLSYSDQRAHDLKIFVQARDFVPQQRAPQHRAPRPIPADPYEDPDGNSGDDIPF